MNPHVLNSPIRFSPNLNMDFSHYMKWIFFQVLTKRDKAKHNKQLIKKLWKPWQKMLLFAYFTVEVFLEKYDFKNMWPQTAFNLDTQMAAYDTL